MKKFPPKVLVLVCFLSFSQTIYQITYESLILLKSSKLNGTSNFSREKIILGVLRSENGISALVEIQSKKRSEMSEVCACVGRVGRGFAAWRMSQGDATNSSEDA